MLSAPASLYLRYGDRYLMPVLLAALPTGYMTGFLATAAAALYVDMSAAQFVRLVLASWLVLWTPEAVLDTRLVRRGVGPITSWIRGARGESQTLGAWQAAADLPLALLGNWQFYAAAVPGKLLADSRIGYARTSQSRIDTFGQATTPLSR